MKTLDSKGWKEESSAGDPHEMNRPSYLNVLHIVIHLTAGGGDDFTQYLVLYLEER